MQYNTKTHAANLTEMLKMLESPEGNGRTIDGCCPAVQETYLGDGRFKHEKCLADCKVCMEFVGMDVGYYTAGYCPCWKHGTKKALDETKTALKRYYRQEAGS